MGGVCTVTTDVCFRFFPMLAAGMIRIFDEKDQLLRKNQDYLEVFCLSYRMVPLLRSLSLENRIRYNNFAKQIFQTFQETHPFGGLGVDEGLLLIENMIREESGSVTEFCRRIMPFRELKQSFKELNESMIAVSNL